MNAEQKKQFLNQLLDQPIDPARPPFDVSSRGARLLWHTGAPPQPWLRADKIWKKHNTVVSPGRQLRFPRKIFYPLVAAAALVIAAVAVIPGLLRDSAAPSNPGTVVAGIRASYRDSARVFVQSAENYEVREQADALVISAQQIDARIDFSASDALRTVVIRTPRATFTIVGTSIAVSAGPDRSALHVVTGKVRVETTAGTEFVSRGEVWSMQKDEVLKRPEVKSDIAHYLDLGQGASVPEHREPPDRAEPKRTPPLRPLPPESRDGEKAPGPGAFKPELEKPAPEVEKRPVPEKHAERGEHAEERADREARRADREARRTERQAGRSERHK
jgi:hypothetical protein